MAVLMVVSSYTQLEFVWDSETIAIQNICKQQRIKNDYNKTISWKTALSLWRSSHFQFNL